ncbi:MAG: Lrp/AsnC ligand binding domain-containing protein [Pseudomonadota bacterium]
MVTAFILINAERHQIVPVAERLAEISQISEVYSVGGQYDLIALARVKQNEDLAALVTKELPKVDGIAKTETLMAFQAFSKHDLERLFSVGM